MPNYGSELVVAVVVVAVLVVMVMVVTCGWCADGRGCRPRSCGVFCCGNGHGDCSYTVCSCRPGYGLIDRSLDSRGFGGSGGIKFLIIEVLFVVAIVVVVVIVVEVVTMLVCRHGCCLQWWKVVVLVNRGGGGHHYNVCHCGRYHGCVDVMVVISAVVILMMAVIEEVAKTSAGTEHVNN